MVPVPKDPAPLPPSVDKRLNDMYKTPGKEGVVSDKTSVKGATPELQAKWKADEEKRRQAQADAATKKAEADAAAQAMKAEQARAAELAAIQKADAEKAAAALTAQKKAEEAQAKKIAASLPPPSLPAPKPDVLSKPAAPVKLEKTEIGALPKLDNKALLGTTPPMPTPAAPPAKELPKLPELSAPPATASLPSLTALTGDTTPNSMDALQPRDAVDSAPLPPPGGTTGLPSLPDAGDNGAPIARRTLEEVDVASTPSAPVKVTRETPPPIMVPLPPAPVAAPAPPSKTVAPAASSGALENSVSFVSGKADLSEDAKAELSAIADKVKKSPGSSIRVVGYAPGNAEEASVARRLSNTRALQVRAFLLSKGVSPLSINVQALGNQIPSGDGDRADVFIK